eukprot:scaffold10091_cov54-Phaeocystis_antarctica.AAC.3
MVQASIMTRGGIVQPIQYLVGMAMVARGEFAFLVAYSARVRVRVRVRIRVSRIRVRVSRIRGRVRVRVRVRVRLPRGLLRTVHGRSQLAGRLCGYSLLYTHNTLTPLPSRLHYHTTTRDHTDYTDRTASTY